MKPVGLLSGDSKNVREKREFYYKINYICKQRCTNAECQDTVAIKYITIAPNKRGYSLWKSLHVTLLAPGFLRRLLHFSKISAPPFLR
jgi:hypothetical protein